MQNLRLHLCRTVRARVRLLHAVLFDAYQPAHPIALSHGHRRHGPRRSIRPSPSESYFAEAKSTEGTQPLAKRDDEEPRIKLATLRLEDDTFGFPSDTQSVKNKRVMSECSY